MNYKLLIMQVAKRCGFLVRRRSIRSCDELRLKRFFELFNVDFVIDVGGNSGQFAKMLRANGYRGRILSFEPLSSAHHLLREASRTDATWTPANRMAIGDVDGEIEIHESQNSYSSSILSISQQHIQGAPESAYISKEKVPIRRLDTLWGNDIPTDASSYFLKIDTQGYEGHGLSGAQTVLRNVVGIHVELSLTELYEGQQLYDSIMRRLIDAGFDLWAVSPAFIDPSTGRQLQIDGLFMRRGTLPHEKHS